MHHQKPVHALRLRADQIDALPVRKRRERRVRRTGDEIDGAVAQRLVSLADWEDQLDRSVDTFARKESELDRGHRWKVGVGDQIGDRDFHATTFRWSANHPGLILRSERVALASRRMATSEVPFFVAVLRDARLRRAPQDEFGNYPNRSAGGAISVTRSRTSFLLDSGASCISRACRRAVQA